METSGLLRGRYSEQWLSKKNVRLTIAGILAVGTLTLVIDIANKDSSGTPSVLMSTLDTTASVSGKPALLTNVADYCYDDPKCDQSTWPGLCATGTQQSPINIAMPTAEYTLSREENEKFVLNSQYRNQKHHPFYAQNDGHTLQLELASDPDELDSSLTISGGGLNDTYKFSQLHFHWAQDNDNGSEHTIDGHRFPLEMQVLHHRSKYGTLHEALAAKNDRAAVAILAVFFTLSRHENRGLQPIIEAASQLVIPGNVKEFHSKLRLGVLYPNYGKADFARYLGSLTNPTCNENVIWSVFLDTQEINRKQMNAFRYMRNSEGVSSFNFRTVQPLNGRQVDFFGPSRTRSGFEKFIF